MAVSEIRQATVKRKTSETDIALFLRIDGSGEAEVDTGIGFFDHMLKSFAKHGLFDLKLKVTGDLIVTATILSKMSELYLEKLSKKL